MIDMYRFDAMLTDLEYPHVICGQCAVARNGLTTQNYTHLDLFTEYEALDHLNLAIVMYYYNPSIDTEHWVKPMFTNPNLLLPSPERAIVEYMKNEKWCDEGTLIEALQGYEFREDICNLPLLYEVAEFFDVPKETMDYWLNEARTDEEV